MKISLETTNQLGRGGAITFGNSTKVAKIVVDDPVARCVSLPEVEETVRQLREDLDRVLAEAMGWFV